MTRLAPPGTWPLVALLAFDLTTIVALALTESWFLLLFGLGVVGLLAVVVGGADWAFGRRP